jgi:hypothetical protein
MHQPRERRAKPPMTTGEGTQWLEAELEKSKDDLRRDLVQIERKLQRARARLQPANLLGNKAPTILGCAFILGFAICYCGVTLRDLGRPVARTMLTTFGRRLAIQAITGRR